MTIDRYDIYFSAKVMDGYDLVKVKQAVAHIFRADDARVELLFSGKSIRIKQSVDAETAGQYRAILRKAGMLLDIRPSEVATPVEQESQSNETPPLTGMEVSEDDPLFELLPANTGTLEDCAPPPPPPLNVNIDGLKLDALGTQLAEHRANPVAEIDTSDLSAFPPNSGSLEDCVVEQEPYEIPDITHIKVVDD